MGNHYDDLTQMEAQDRARPRRTEAECDEMVGFVKKARGLSPAKTKSKKKVKRSSAN